VTRIEKQQFAPTLSGMFTNPFYIARKGLLKNIKGLGIYLNGKLLDVGCGTKPYKEYLSYTEYVGMEIEGRGKEADAFYDGKRFPFKKSEFHSVIISQVLEHVFNPDEFLNEVNRVMKTNGVLIITAPFVWDEHEQPFDYARYSSFGIKHLLAKHGFEVETVRKSVNDVSLFAQLINCYLYRQTEHNKLLRRLTTVFVMSFVTMVGIILGKLLPKNNNLYLDNIVFARKK